MNKKILVVSLLMFCISCATSYKGGYSNTKIQEGIYRVTFKGNSYTDENKAADYALLRSSEIALQEGYNYFVILESENKTKTFTGSTSTGRVYSLEKPASSMVIKCFKDIPKENGKTIYKAQEIYNNLSAQYKL